MTPSAKAGLGIFALIVAVVVALGWWVFDGSTTSPRTYRYRLTLTVETPDGERTGSSVVQVKTSFPGGLTRAQGYYTWVEVRGEATVVDLGSRGLLFAVLKGDTVRGLGGEPYTIPVGSIFPAQQFRETSSSDEYAAYLDELDRRKPAGEVPFKDVPLLVRFHDLNEPMSVERVDPFNLAASFGPGVALKRATIEVTDDSITRGIERRLPWLATLKGGYLTGNKHASFGSPLGLHEGDFILR